MFEMLSDINKDLYMDMDHVLENGFIEKFNHNIERLANEEPLGYVLGYEWFYGLKIHVDREVLIPRNETEELVGHVVADMDEFFEHDQLDVCDIATGSGAIAIAIKKEYPQAHVYASDISEGAIKLATQNAIFNSAEVSFFQGDMAEPLIQKGIKVDVCVCNPPYIKDDEHIQISVKDYEPHIALFGGHDGLDLYRKLLDQLPSLLKPKAIVAFEIGYDQSDALISEITMRFDRVTVKTKKDINQKNRMVFLFFE
jgi:release factor glutamine methyltransferase